MQLKPGVSYDRVAAKIRDIEKVDTFPHGKGKDRFKKIETVTANGMILQEVKGALDSILGYLRPSGINIGL